MICKNCGAEIKNTMTFCNKCGSRIIRSQEVDPVNFISQNAPSDPNPTTTQSHGEKASPSPATNMPPQKQTTSRNSNRQANTRHGRYATPSPHSETPTSSSKPKKAEKSKVLAGILGIFLGYFGVQWFYLGKKLHGGLFLAITLLTAAISEDVFAGFAVFCICEGIYFLFASKKSFKKYCASPFKSIVFYIFLLIAFLISLSSEPIENVNGENQHSTGAEVSSQPQPDLIATNTTTATVEENPTEHLPTVSPTESYTETTPLIETEPSDAPSAAATTEVSSETESALSNSLSFVAKQVEYATKCSIELNRFPTEESKLAYWVEHSNEKLLYVDTDNLFGADRYKITESYKGYLYYGELKDNRPDGYGILLAYTENFDYLLSYKEKPYALRYVGEFSDGQFDGFGLLFTESENGRNFLSDLRPYNIDTGENIDLYIAWANYVEYFGEFSGGYKEGKGNSFVLADFYIGLYEKALEEIDIEHPRFSIDVGIYKNDELNGSNKQYVGGYLLYDGESKNGEYDGYGILYHYGTNIPRYEGEFKNGMRHGTGTSYSETGEVVYTGKWKNDDYA